MVTSKYFTNFRGCDLQIIIIGTQLFSDPRMTLGSYVKSPNKIIHREWARKAGPWSLDGRFSRDFHGSSYEGRLGQNS